MQYMQRVSTNYSSQKNKNTISKVQIYNLYTVPTTQILHITIPTMHHNVSSGFC